jgi:polyribonucleotide nucleotidyltransferase
VLAKALHQAKDARLQILDVMEEAIAGPRDDVRPTAPKIISFEIPMDKIGEVIGPKGKVINTITQETGADVAVSDNGIVGIVSIGSKDGSAVAEAKRRIELILDPPTAELGATYTGRVVNVTKFGAFVNILPGRDGLLHISKLGRGKRVDRVEDVLNLGDEVEVRVDDIDNSGKLSLSLLGDDDGGTDGGEGGGDRPARPAREPRRDASPRGDRAESRAAGPDAASGGEERDVVAFEEVWEPQAREQFGDLGPSEATRERTGDSGGARRGGGRRRR